MGSEKCESQTLDPKPVRRDEKLAKSAHVEGRWTSDDAARHPEAKAHATLGAATTMPRRSQCQDNRVVAEGSRKVRGSATVAETLAEQSGEPQIRRRQTTVCQTASDTSRSVHAAVDAVDANPKDEDSATRKKGMLESRKGKLSIERDRESGKPLRLEQGGIKEEGIVHEKPATEM
jgi:hypothetical protein